MDKEVANHVVEVGFRTMRELTDLLHFLKEHVDSAEYETYRKGISAVAGDIAIDILNPAYTAFPELEKKVEEKITRYGKQI